MSMVIDLHAHVVLEESFGAAGKYGPELSSDPKLQEFRVGDYAIRVPYKDSVFMDAQKRVDAMDSLGIDLQLLSPNPLSFFGHKSIKRRYDKTYKAIPGPFARCCFCSFAKS